MSKRDELITLYTAELKDKCNLTPDVDLLTKVTIGVGPSIYREDASTVATSDSEEVARVRTNFLVKKLGLPDGPELDAGIEKAIETYGRSNRNKYRAVFYYLLVKHFGRELAYT